MSPPNISPGAKPKARRYDWVAAQLLMMLGVFGFIVCIGLSSTIHYVDAMAVVAMAIASGELLAAIIVLKTYPLRGDRLVAWLKKGSVRRRLAVGVALPVWLILVPTSAILYANQALDFSPGVAHSLPMIAHYIQSGGTRGGPRYMAGVVPDMQLPPHVLPISSTQWINVGARVYGQLALGDRLIVIVHPGLLGFAWYEDDMRKAP